MTNQSDTAQINAEALSPAVHEIVQHLCEGDCHTFGSVLSWCEARGDCVYAIVCPGCSTQYLIDEDDLAQLERWTVANGDALVCGVQL
jgi:predicted Zn finger-like uncharacterized protein